jgi:hypothetical protein
VSKGSKMAFQTKQIKTYGTNYSQEAFYAVNAKSTYECSNAYITRGMSMIPASLVECFQSFPSITTIGKNVGFLLPENIPETEDKYKPYGNTFFQKINFNTQGQNYMFYLWTGSTGGTGDVGVDAFFPETSIECYWINHELGPDWLGCLWGSPSSNFSCKCPEIGEKFESYIKLRLNDATFWNTPKDTPVKRSEFLDAFKYGKKIEATIAGDFKLKLGQVVYFNANYASGYINDPNQTSDLSGLYYITAMKHVVTNSGGHETSLSLSQIAAGTDYT